MTSFERRATDATTVQLARKGRCTVANRDVIVINFGMAAPTQWPLLLRNDADRRERLSGHVSVLR
jgi:hypothetical protein